LEGVGEGCMISVVGRCAGCVTYGLGAALVIVGGVNWRLACRGGAFGDYIDET